MRNKKLIPFEVIEKAVAGEPKANELVFDVCNCLIIFNSHDVSKFSKEAISLSHSIFNSYTFIMYCIKSSIGLSIGENSWSISYSLLIR